MPAVVLEPSLQIYLQLSQPPNYVNPVQTLQGVSFAVTLLPPATPTPWEIANGLGLKGGFYSINVDGAGDDPGYPYGGTILTAWTKSAWFRWAKIAGVGTADFALAWDSTLVDYGGNTDLPSLIDIQMWGSNVQYPTFADLTFITTTSSSVNRTVTANPELKYFPSGTAGSKQVSVDTTAHSFTYYFVQMVGNQSTPDYPPPFVVLYPAGAPTTKLSMGVRLRSPERHIMGFGIKLEPVSKVKYTMGFRGTLKYTPRKVFKVGIGLKDRSPSRFGIGFGLTWSRIALAETITIGLVGQGAAQFIGAAGDGGGIAVGGHVSLSVTPPVMLPSLLVRPALIINVVMPDVPVINGYPEQGLVWARPAPVMSVNEGPDHTRYLADPDPNKIPPGKTSPTGWGDLTVPTYQWSANDLATPAWASEYKLSTWPEHSGGPAWKSGGNFRPQVRGINTFSPRNVAHTYSQAVIFEPTFAQHMWVDLGPHSQPYTWIFVGIINSYPTRTYGHYILDAGVRPHNLHWDARDQIHTNADPYNRTLMLFQLHSAILFGDHIVNNGPYARAQHNYVPRPRMLYGVFNGSHSKVGWRDPAQHRVGGGKASAHTSRYFVTGRRNAYFDSGLASHITLFEIRFFASALSSAMLDKHYKQIAGSWKFNLYKNGG